LLSQKRASNLHRALRLAVACLSVAACAERRSQPVPSAIGTEPTRDQRPLVAVSARQVRVDGALVFTVPLEGRLGEGEIDAVVTALRPRCRSWATVTLEGEVPYSTLFPVFFSVQRAGCGSFDLGLRGAAPLPHPARHPARTTELAAAPPLGGKLRLTVNVAPDRLTLSSETRELSLAIEGAPALTTALADLVTHCWPAGDRTPEDRQIFVVARRGVRADQLLPVLHATRAAGGRVLFPDHVFLPPHRAGRDPQPSSGELPSATEQQAAGRVLSFLLVSRPAGARVQDARAVLLGVTPLVLRLPRSLLPASLRLTRDGYAAASVRLDASAPRRVEVELSSLGPRLQTCPPLRARP